MLDALAHLRMRASRLWNNSAQCDARVRTLAQFMLLNSILAEPAAQGVACAHAQATGRGLYLAAETLLGGFAPSLRGISVGLRLPAVLVRLTPSEPGALKAAIYRV